MKKLIFASIVMLATLTACQNSESTVNPEEQQRQTFQSKTTAREGEELPPLSAEEEKAVIEEASKTLMLDREAELKGESPDTGRKAMILCHTNYTAESGHACVYNSSGYLVTVTWSTEYDTFPVGGSIGVYPDGNTVYHGTVTPRCNC